MKPFRTPTPSPASISINRQNEELVAPLCAKGKSSHLLLGVIEKKPWDYKVTVCVPHWCTPQLIPILVQLYWYQSIEPYILIIDTGSSKEDIEELEKLRNQNVEIHYLRPHALIHASETISTAIDLSIAMCKTSHLFLTHSDCFPMSQTLLEELYVLCDKNNPVVGYQMSQRDEGYTWTCRSDASLNSDIKNEWRQIPGHVCTMLYIPTILNLGIRYSMNVTSLDEILKHPALCDTETSFGKQLVQKGVKPLFIGAETNFLRQTDSRIDHFRSYTSFHRVHSKDSIQIIQKNSEAQDAIEKAKARIEIWRRNIDWLTNVANGKRP